MYLRDNTVISQNRGRRVEIKPLDDYCDETIKDEINITSTEAIKRIKECMNTPNFQPYSYINDALNMAIEALGKNTPKKSVHQGCYDKEGKWHEWNGINGRPYELCPSCGNNLCCEMLYDKKPKYCDNCGQKLDWSEIKEVSQC